MDTINEPKKVKARKEHQCDYCDKAINKGEEHIVATYKGDYSYTLRACNRCKPYVDEAFRNKDYDWSDGMGWQDFHDYMYEEHRDIAVEWWQSIKQN